MCRSMEGISTLQMLNSSKVYKRLKQNDSHTGDVKHNDSHKSDVKQNDSHQGDVKQNGSHKDVKQNDSVCKDFTLYSLLSYCN